MLLKSVFVRFYDFFNYDYIRKLKSDSVKAKPWELLDEKFYPSGVYERLLSSQDKKPVVAEATEHTAELSPRDVLEDPYVLEFLELGERSSFTESELELALINKLQSFLLELGKGFSFVARQQRINLEGKNFYIDFL